MHAKSLILYIFLSPLSLYSAAQPPVKTIMEFPVEELPAYGFYTFEGEAVAQKLGKVQVTFDWEGRYKGHDFVRWSWSDRGADSRYVRGASFTFAIRLFKGSGSSFSFATILERWRVDFENSDLAEVARMIDQYKEIVVGVEKSSSSCIIL